MLSEDHEHAILSAVLLANNRPGACSRKHSKSIDVQQKYSNITSNLKKKTKQTNKQTNSVTHKPTYLFVTLLMTGIATVTMRPRPDASK